MSYTYPNISDPRTIQRVKQYLYKHGFADISSYKEKYLARRIAIRMRKLELVDFEDYYDVLVNRDKEIGLLKKTLSVNVTEFFRDRDTWIEFKRFLKKYIDEKRNRKMAHQLRIWSAGCAIGPEPYSIAMTVHNVLGARNLKFDVKVFATDFNEELLAVARRGIYERGDILKNVPADFLATYFESFGRSGFRVKYAVKRLVSFGWLNLISSQFLLKNLDFIMCRNVLIYFDKNIQRKIMQKFHQCLNSQGVLILGRTEMLHPELRAENFFTVEALKHRMYRKTADPRIAPVSRPQIQEDENKRFKCLKCGRIFTKLPELKKHEVKGYCGRVFRCKKCFKRFESEVRLRAHTKYWHKTGIASKIPKY